MASLEGARVCIRSRVGRLSDDPDTVVVLCDNVKGLGVALDPSHYLQAKPKPKNYDKLMPYTYHTYLRDSTKDEIQV